tara:strand:- start:203 stop:394 length:192 start_codon:yes stop_codon:yes gene_type:complete
MNIKLHKEQWQEILDSYQWIIDDAENDPDVKEDPLYKIYFQIKAQLNDPNPIDDKFIEDIVLP